MATIINQISGTTKTTFSALQRGDFYLYGGNLYIKSVLYGDNQRKINAVRIKDGVAVTMAKGDSVIPVDVTINYNYK